MNIFQLMELGLEKQQEITNDYLSYIAGHKKSNYSFVKPATFEEYMEKAYKKVEEEYYNIEDLIKCENCNQELPEEDYSENRFEEDICNQCLIDGYGA